MSEESSAFELAQVNIGRAVAALDSPRLADFMANLDRINALAERSPGFVWRLQSDSGNATDIQVSDDPRLIINLSVWQSVEALAGFAYRTAHSKFVVRRAEWFEALERPYLALWWVPAGHRPDVAEAMARLDRLAELGPSPEAFTFKTSFPPPDSLAAAE